MQDDRHRQLFFVAQMAGKEGLDRLGLVTGSTFIKLNQLDRSVGNPRVPIQHSVQRRVVLSRISSPASKRGSATDSSGK